MYSRFLLCFPCARSRNSDISKNPCFPCLQNSITHDHIDQWALLLLDSLLMVLLAIRLRTCLCVSIYFTFSASSSTSAFWTRKKKVLKIIFRVVSMLQLGCLWPHWSSGLIWLIWRLCMCPCFLSLFHVYPSQNCFRPKTISFLNRRKLFFS